MSVESDPLLEMRGIEKSFAGTKALLSADLVVGHGEVHGLMGQNGAGKSTLLKILTGVYVRDGGTIRFSGADASFTSPHDAQNHGISPIYQEINLVPGMTVAENIFLGREPTRWGFLDAGRMATGASKLLERVGVELDPRRELGSLSTATQQMVAIARALSFDAKLLIMDEPTSSLHDREVATLFDSIRQLRDDGVAIIFVSHKLDELYEICDSITVLRDGRTVATSAMAALGKVELVATMLGREASTVATVGQTAFDRRDASTGKSILHTDHLASWPLLRDATVEVREGEIVGLAGLLGSGRTEFARAVSGAAPVDNGTVVLKGSTELVDTPAKAAKQGIAVTHEDRKVDGLVGVMSVRENITLPLLGRLSHWGVINRRRESAIVMEFVKRLQIKASGPDQTISELSGGNQQKALLARSLAMEPGLLILDEPTRGVDVGAKAEIQSLISESVSEGRGVLLISSEMEEIVEGSDRVYVMRDGVSIAEMGPDQLTTQRVMTAMAAGAADDAHSAPEGGR